MTRSRDRIFVRGGSDVSFIDYPGRIAAILFAASCNFRCGYCHNPLLVNVPVTASYWRYDELLERISSLRGKIDGVVVTGGEPTLHADMPDIIDELHSLSLPIKLNTNGSTPSAVRASLSSLSHVSLDIKTALNKYRRVCTIPDAAIRVHETLSLLRESPIVWDLRITAAPGILDEADVDALLPVLTGAHVILQKFDPANTLDENYASMIPYTSKTMERIRARIAGVAVCELI
ncbi:MAG: anaerobic ribonucleoside-triphosphate reductase activating protein [Spirochaetota bacterium]